MYICVTLADAYLCTLFHSLVCKLPQILHSYWAKCTFSRHILPCFVWNLGYLV